jgi:hypothetical protein
MMILLFASKIFDCAPDSFGVGSLRIETKVFFQFVSGRGVSLAA